VEELGPAEAGISLSALGVQDSELGPSIGRAIPIASDDHLRPLADDVPTEAKPVATPELESEGGRVGDRAGEGRAGSGRLEDDQARVRSAGEGSQPSQSIGQPLRPAFTCRQVEHEEIDGPGGKE
jgi:hypothetical protein